MVSFQSGRLTLPADGLLPAAQTPSPLRAPHLRRAPFHIFSRLLSRSPSVTRCF